MESKLVVRVLMALTTMSILVTLLTIQQPNRLVRFLIGIMTVALLLAIVSVVRHLPLVDGTIIWFTDRRVRRRLASHRLYIVLDDPRVMLLRLTSPQPASSLNPFFTVERDSLMATCYRPKAERFEATARYPHDFDGPLAPVLPGVYRVSAHVRDKGQVAKAKFVATPSGTLRHTHWQRLMTWQRRARNESHWKQEREMRAKNRSS